MVGRKLWYAMTPHGTLCLTYDWRTGELRVALSNIDEPARQV